MLRLVTVFSVLVGVLVCADSIVLAQTPDLTSQTLDFRNVTSTNVIQLSADMPGGNEKDIAFADFDNDGDNDVLISMSRSDFGQRSNKLYVNEGGMLNEVSGTSVIPGFAIPDVARSAFFRDYDGDGFADIIVACDSNSGTATNTSAGRTKYFRNINGRSFVNESERLGNIFGSATNATSADFDANGFDDLVLVNEPNSSQDAYALNNLAETEPGVFTVVTSTDMVTENNYGDNGEAADMNGDGLCDLLIANSSSFSSFIFYNNNAGQGSGPGDFSYVSPGSCSSFPGIDGLDERVLFPGDFDGDGRTDFYFSNRVRDGEDLQDFVMQNVGNDEFNRAEFVAIPMPETTFSETMKVRSADLDADGRIDLLVSSEFRRPQIFRNTSENGSISFVEWTPAVFTTAHAGWQANSADLVGEQRNDVLVGALQDEHLFENQTSDLFEVADLTAGELPPFHNSAPIAVVGNSAVGDSFTLETGELPAGANVSVLVRSLGAVGLTVSQNGVEIASSNRSGSGTDQAIQFVVPGDGVVSFEIAMEAIIFDGNGDGEVNLLDIDFLVDCLNGNSSDCDAFDINDDGGPDLLVVQPFIAALLTNSNSQQFVVELLSRDD